MNCDVIDASFARLIGGCSRDKKGGDSSQPSGYVSSELKGK